MTQEEKNLLLKDLCARLPYGVKAQVKINVEYSEAHKPDSETCIGDVWGITTNKPYTAWVYSFITIYPCGPEQNMCSISECKPYLRPMSSMTGEEKKNWLESIHHYNFKGQPCLTYIESYDWLNKNHFDYRGLIPMGLALEAPEGMYKEWISIRDNLKEDKEGNIVGGLKL